MYHLKQYNPFTNILTIPKVYAQEIINNEIQNTNEEPSVIYETFSKKDIVLSIQSQCLERNRIFLSEQEDQIKFEMLLSQPPNSNINVTFINDQPDLFTVEPKSILYKSAYSSVTTKNNTVINIVDNHYNLIQYFNIKTFKNNGSAKLMFNINTDLNKVYEYENNKVVEEQTSNNNNSLNRLIIDKSVSKPLEVKATSSNVGTMNTFLILWIVLFMFSIGLSLSGNTIKGLYSWKRLKPFICGYVCQLIINPLVAFILTKIFKLSEYISLGVIIVAASPGSFIAPVFTYYLGGDRALAVGLCLIATIFGSFTFPFTIWLFCIVLKIKIETYIPIWETFSLSATQIIPLGIGCVILHFKPNWASKLRKGCPLWAIAIILTSLITSIKNYGQIFINSWKAYSMPIILGLISYIIGFVVPRVFGMNNQQVRAICFNTGLQNSPLALTVIQVLGMPSCGQLMSLVPLHHSLWTVVEGVIIAIAMFFLFPTDVKAIEENSEFPIMLTTRNEEENKAILQDDYSENYSSNMSMMEDNVLDISDINIHQHLTYDTNPATPTSMKQPTYKYCSGSPTTNHSTLSIPRQSNSPNLTGSPTMNIIRKDSVKSGQSTVAQNSLRDTNGITMKRNSNLSNITILSYGNNNKLSPILKITPTTHQRKSSTTSTIKFKQIPTSSLHTKTPISQASSSNTNSELGLEIIGLPPHDPSSNTNTDIKIKKDRQKDHNPVNSTKECESQIPSKGIQNKNKRRSSSPTLPSTPYQNQNNNKNVLLKGETRNTVKKENESPAKEIEIENENQEEMPMHSTNKKKEEKILNNNIMEKDKDGHNKDQQKPPKTSLTHHSPIYLSQVMNKYLPLVFKKSTPDVSNSPSPPPPSSQNTLPLNSTLSSNTSSSMNPTLSNALKPTLTNSSSKNTSSPTLPNPTLSIPTLSIALNSTTPTPTLPSSSNPTLPTSTLPNSSNPTTPTSTLPNSSNPNLLNPTISNPTTPNSTPLNSSTPNYNNKGHSSLNSPNLDPKACLNTDNDNVNLNSNSFPSHTFKSNIVNYYLGEPELDNNKTLHGQMNPLDQLNKNNFTNNHVDQQSLIDFDTQPVKLFNIISSPSFSANTNSTNHTNHTLLTNHNSIQSLKKKKNRVYRTDTIQTFETANSNQFNSFVYGDGSVKSIKEDDLVEESDGEDVDDDDEMFKECSFEFQTKGFEGLGKPN
ncbi:hypothetical protein BCR36DRAFT_580922 [Piromyces finnis]|uniref:SBF-domain-containing protein n=1 Tax=Piromyces finnis TaxID=1754191 RepID=A0A1Y1VIW1_9FUNG|nr:hypothetical protein BCR36DRAFT_580922 [Piromyces finnis]|eukprot:ORX56607.1 hypothetical protein BCR36DRAFT_580922 [Piromyces finnis]